MSWAPPDVHRLQMFCSVCAVFCVCRWKIWCQFVSFLPLKASFVLFQTQLRRFWKTLPCFSTKTESLYNHMHQICCCSGSRCFFFGSFLTSESSQVAAFSLFLNSVFTSLELLWIRRLFPEVAALRWQKHDAALREPRHTLCSLIINSGEGPFSVKMNLWAPHLSENEIFSSRLWCIHCPSKGTKQT